MLFSTPDPPNKGAEASCTAPHPSTPLASLLCIPPAVSLGITYSFGIFIGYLEAEFEWSREAVSGIFALNLGLTAVFFMLSQWVYTRYGPRPLLPIIILAGGAGLLSSAHADALWQFMLSYGVLFALGSGTISGFVMSTFSRWPPQPRKTYIGAAGTGIAVGILIVTFAISRLTSSYGWRDAFTVLSILMWAAAVPTAALHRNPLRSAIPSGAVPGQTRWNPRSRNSWFLPFACLAYAFALHLVIGHTVVRAEGIEMSALRAGALLTVMAAAALPSRMLAAWVIRNLGEGTAGVAFTLLHAAAIFWFVDPDGTRSYFLFAIVYGIAIGGMSRFATDALGKAYLRLLIPPLAVLWAIGSALGPWVGGRIVDHTEGYEFAFFCAGLAAMAAAVSIWGMKSTRPSFEETTAPVVGGDRSEHAGDILNDAHGKEEHDAGERQANPQNDEGGTREGKPR